MFAAILLAMIALYIYVRCSPPEKNIPPEYFSKFVSLKFDEGVRWKPLQNVFAKKRKLISNLSKLSLLPLEFKKTIFQGLQLLNLNFLPKLFSPLFQKLSSPQWQFTSNLMYHTSLILKSC